MKSKKNILDADEISNWLDIYHDGLEDTGIDYLKALLLTLWKEGECFSGKRPFGNGDWQSSVYESLVHIFPNAGKLDDDGFLEECNEELLNDYMKQIIDYIFSEREI